MNKTPYDRLGGRPKLEELLHYFYADIRQHELLAPIFNEIITDWSHHLKIIADFWARMTGGPSDYSGQMPAKHIPLGLKEAHFQAWLGLWEHHCHARLKPDSAKEMIALANQIADRLRRVSQLPTVNGSGMI